MIGLISLLYGLLLHSGVSSRGDTPPPQLPNQIELLVISTLRMLNYIAVMNLQAFQVNFTFSFILSNLNFKYFIIFRSHTKSLLCILASF